MDGFKMHGCSDCLETVVRGTKGSVKQREHACCAVQSYANTFSTERKRRASFNAMDEGGIKLKSFGDLLIIQKKLQK